MLFPLASLVKISSSRTVPAEPGRDEGSQSASQVQTLVTATERRNARTTLTWMVSLLIALFAGTIALVHFDGVVPNAHQTVLSQLAHRNFGPGVFYAFTQASTAAILLLAADTAYNDFPRVLFLLARSQHAPRLFLRIGDRLSFSNGIILLSAAAAAIFIGFAGNTESLIPLFAVGVFLAFTMSQAGMVVHWLRHRDDPHWRRSLFFNATGGLLSSIVFITAGITKFTSGAWVAILAIGLFILVAMRIRRHYDLVAAATALHPHAIEVPSHRITPHPGDGGVRSEPHADGELTGQSEDPEDEAEESPEQVRNLTIVPIAALDLPSMRALAYAAALQQPLLALHVSPTEDEAERFRGYWSEWGNHLPLEVIVSPHRALVAPMVNYISSLHRQRPDLTADRDPARDRRTTLLAPDPAQPHLGAPAARPATAPEDRGDDRSIPPGKLGGSPLSWRD